jgi:hypothetical protein
MGIFTRGPKDQRDQVGQNPTGRARKSSAGKRRQEENRLERDLQGSPFEFDPLMDDED